MSTKLYNGLRLKDSGADIFEIIPLVAKAIRRELIEASEQLVGEELALRGEDKAFLKNLSPSDTLWFEAEEAWRKQQAAWGPHHRLNDPLRFSMVFGRSCEGNLLAYSFTDRPSYAKALEALDIFEDYGYWNNTDRPAELTEAQWALRSKEWDSLMDESGSFGSLPLWELGGESDPWRAIFLHEVSDENLNHYRGQDERLAYALTDALLQEFMKSDGRENLMSNYSKAQRWVKAFLKTSAGVELPRPEPLPESFMAKVEDFPTPYQVSEELLRELVAFGEQSKLEY